MKRTGLAGAFYHYLAPITDKPYSFVLMWAVFLLEIVLFIPLDFVIVLFSLKHRKRFVFISATAAFCSMISGIVGYYGAFYAFKHLSDYFFIFFSQERFFNLVEAYKKKGPFLVFFMALMPFPFKLLVLSSGFAGLPLMIFAPAIFVSRFLRFMTISLIAIKLEDKMFDAIEKYSYLFISISMGVVMILLLKWYLG